jgi:hypothetical protein
MGAQERTPLASSPLPSPVHMVDSNMRGRWPVAIFLLACRKSSRTPRTRYALSAAEWLPAYISSNHLIAGATSPRSLSVNLLISRVGGGDISTHRRA